jgi:hypothetical protein
MADFRRSTDTVLLSAPTVLATSIPPRSPRILELRDQDRDGSCKKDSDEDGDEDDKCGHESISRSLLRVLPSGSTAQIASSSQSTSLVIINPNTSV